MIELRLGEVGLLRLDHPPLNLFNRQMTEALDQALGRIEAEPGMRALVVAGNQRAFSAGSDINEFAGLAGRVGEGKLIRENQVYDRLAQLSLPTVAAIEGIAFGGGLELALCCDLRVASESARLALPEVRLGVIPGSGGTHRLPRLIGPAQAKEMILRGAEYSAAEAHGFGLVNAVTATGQAEATAKEWAEEIAARGPLAVREAKLLIDSFLDPEAAAASLAASERVFATEDLGEGVAAFKEKRPPRFVGR
ncbi:MAG TPA: enoyl-CoA hydratase-related protein [Acidimicrobiia bacterium]|nr:enoyl-CoA hydratase-related protein [Acidimicrobiia bacterium]